MYGDSRCVTAKNCVTIFHYGLDQTSVVRRRSFIWGSITISYF